MGDPSLPPSPSVLPAASHPQPPPRATPSCQPPSLTPISIAILHLHHAHLRRPPPSPPPPRPLHHHPPPSPPPLPPPTPSLSTTPTLSTTPPSLATSLSTTSTAAVQSAIRARISTTPPPPTHLAIARVPVAIAQILTHELSLISLAVNAFYDRDVDSMKLAAKMEMFPAGETVLTSVRMTRAVYSQHVRQRFAAPKGYVMPAAGEKGFAEAERGMKIAVGFEMMYGMRRREGEEGKGEMWEVFLRILE